MVIVLNKFTRIYGLKSTVSRHAGIYLTLLSLYYHLLPTSLFACECFKQVFLEHCSCPTLFETCCWHKNTSKTLSILVQFPFLEEDNSPSINIVFYWLIVSELNLWSKPTCSGSSCAELETFSHSQPCKFIPFAFLDIWSEQIRA